MLVGIAYHLNGLPRCLVHDCGVDIRVHRIAVLNLADVFCVGYNLIDFLFVYVVSRLRAYASCYKIIGNRLARVSVGEL